MARDESAISVEVVYALPQRQALAKLTVRKGTTALEAVLLSSLKETYPGIAIDLAQGKIGIFGKRVAPDTLLNDGDRVEIYRPLTADPKEARRRRARKSK